MIGGSHGKITLGDYEKFIQVIMKWSKPVRSGVK